jgi:lipid II:glycine glycyltransferase (peptidoglycan interpeptide bridge formation enzyme)
MVRWAKASGCETIDWGGSGTSFPPLESDPGYGIYQFKLGFGCKLEEMTGYYDFVLRKPLYVGFRFVERRVLPAGWRLRSRFNRRRWFRPLPADPPATSPP